MYGNSKVTPVHSCYSNFIFYYWLHFDYHFIKNNDFVHLHSMGHYTWAWEQPLLMVKQASEQVLFVKFLRAGFVPPCTQH